MLWRKLGATLRGAFTPLASRAVPPRALAQRARTAIHTPTLENCRLKAIFSSHLSVREPHASKRCKSPGKIRTMKNTFLNKRTQGSRPSVRHPGLNGFSQSAEHEPLNWPTEKELQQVSIALAKIRRSGMRHEEAGDYFICGDVAYQLQEILQATQTLVTKTRRRDN